MRGEKVVKIPKNEHLSLKNGIVSKTYFSGLQVMKQLHVIKELSNMILSEGMQSKQQTVF